MSHSIIGTCRGSFRFLRVPVSHNDCFMKVKLSVFLGFTELVLLHNHFPHVYNQYKTSLQNSKILTMFLLLWKNFTDWLEIKMTNADPSAARQHVQPLKKKYFKAWFTN